MIADVNNPDYNAILLGAKSPSSITKEGASKQPDVERAGESAKTEKGSESTLSKKLDQAGEASDTT
jgi:hypothetical protein